MNQKFNLDKKAMIQSFNQASISYNNVAFIQREVGQRLMERLDIFAANPTTILDLGMGTGIITEQLTKKYKEASIVGIDIAYHMVKEAKTQMPATENTFFICSEAATLPFLDNSFDMIISNMVLHWCPDLYAVFMELHRVLRPDGILMFSTLGPDTLKELRASFAKADNYSHVNSFFDMHIIGDDMLAAHLKDPVMDIEYVTVTYKTVQDIMRDLKQLGAHNVIQNRCKGLTGKNRFKQMIQHYETYRTEKSVLPVTYEVVYGHALGNELEKKYGLLGSDEFEIPITSIKRVK